MNDLCIRGSGESGIAGKRVQENFCFATPKKVFSHATDAGDFGIKGLRSYGVKGLRNLSAVGRIIPDAPV